MDSWYCNGSRIAFFYIFVVFCEIIFRYCFLTVLQSNYLLFFNVKCHRKTQSPRFVENNEHQWLHGNENPIYVFPENELCSLSPNFHIHVPVSELYNLRIGPKFSCSRIGRPIVGI
jgi:hypothetical protein